MSVVFDLLGKTVGEPGKAPHTHPHGQVLAFHVGRADMRRANVYLEPVDSAFANNVDYARLVKLYGPAPDSQHRYSPAGLAGIRLETVTGNPDRAHISTSYAERHNLNLRMHQRRMTRLTNGFSKKIENLAASISLYAMWYNFHRQHSTLKVSPAMEIGIADHLWSYGEIAELVTAAEDARPRKRGPYKKQIA